ncbi:MAG TPA: hypothetical protein VMU73_11130 [Gaiellaceae bacterium]|nr:hypothetical protein [Gaiellaceae bacterium]
MTLLAFSRPFWPLFLHVLGAMALVGAILSAVITAVAAWRRPDLAILRTATFWALVSAIPDYVVMRVFAEVIRSDEGYKNPLPQWLTLGQGIADGGVLLLLAAIGTAYWWRRSGTPRAGRIVAGLSSVYLVLLAVAWLAMSGKWG